MGISLGLLSKFGMVGVDSLIGDQAYERFFKSPEITKFDQFHTAYIDLCKSLNDIMPGKHFKIPPSKDIEDFHKTWVGITDETEKKKKLAEFVKENVTELKPDDKAMIITGMVVPAAAMMLKNNVENIPPVKRFKLHLVPNVVFVPMCTFLALAGVQVMQISKKSKS